MKQKRFKDEGGTKREIINSVQKQDLSKIVLFLKYILTFSNLSNVTLCNYLKNFIRKLLT